MGTVLKLSIIAALPVAVSIVLYVINRATAFGKLDNKYKQLIYGVIFGGIAVLGTEFGVDVGGAVANSRDAVVLTAGLVFGAPAGIIAGLIGGIERYFAVFWGAGAYTQIACTVSTILAGVIGAVLRRYMFDDKKPSALYAFGIGLVTEVIHMLMIFFTNMSDVTVAFGFVEKCALPMIAVNGLAVMFSVFAVTMIGKEKIRGDHRQKQITTVFQHWLLLCVIVAFVVTSMFTLFLQAEISDNDANKLLALNIQDVTQDISDASDKNLLSLTRTVVEELETGIDLAAIAEKHDIAEINLIDNKGLITDSTYPDFVGYDMADGEQSGAFLVLLGDAQEIVQSYQPISFGEGISRKYAGKALPDGGFVQVGYDAEQFQRDIDNEVVGATRNRHVGKNGCIIIADENWNVVSDRNGNEGKNLDVTGIWIDTQTMPEGVRFTTDVYGEQSYCMYVVSEGYYIVAVLPESEAIFSRNVSIYITAFMEIVVFVSLFILIYFLIKRLVVNNIQKVNDSLAQITGGNLDVTVDVRENEEFASLSDDINSTVVTLKHYISEAAARLDQELEYAKAIQHAALPSVFPPFPSRTDFDIYARMDTTKEVGGDFYDFYLLGEDTLAILIADVSGKGIPAAMFMMTAKTMLKSCAEAGMAVNEVFTRANQKLCEENEAGMFVTAWMGFIDLKTGHAKYCNAGHNPPLIRKGGEWSWLKGRSGLVLADTEGIKYRVQELDLAPGDEIFLYTDGVTEATNTSDELYSDPRLLSTLCDMRAGDTKSLCDIVKSNVDAFAGDAPQFDDITMLAFHYFGGVTK